MKRLVFVFWLCASAAYGEVVSYQFSGTIDTVLNGPWFPDDPFPEPQPTFHGTFSYNTDTPYATVSTDLGTFPWSGVGIWRYPVVTMPIQFSATAEGTGTGSYTALGMLDYTLRAQGRGDTETLTLRSTSLRTTGSPVPQWMAIHLVDHGGSLIDGSLSALPLRLPKLSENVEAAFYLGGAVGDPYLSGPITSLVHLPEPATWLLLVLGVVLSLLLKRGARWNRNKV